MNEYRPEPPDVSGLSPDWNELVERIAERVHDAWAAERLAQGWRLGQKRDDDARLHPQLVPYAQLGERERELDRRVVRTVIAALIESGVLEATPP